MISMANARAVLAAVLVVSLTLPVASCTKWLDEQGREPFPVGASKVDTTKYHRVTTYYYPLEDVTVREPRTLLIPLVFLWPFVAVMAARWRPEALITKIISWLEPLGLAYSAAFIESNVIFNHPEMGYYIALGAIGALFLTWLWMTFDRFRRWRAARAAQAAA